MKEAGGAKDCSGLALLGAVSMCNGISFAAGSPLQAHQLCGGVPTATPSTLLAELMSARRVAMAFA